MRECFECNPQFVMARESGPPSWVLQGRQVGEVFLLRKI